MYSMYDLNSVAYSDYLTLLKSCGWNIIKEVMMLMVTLLIIILKGGKLIGMGWIGYNQAIYGTIH